MPNPSRRMCHFIPCPDYAIDNADYCSFHAASVSRPGVYIIKDSGQREQFTSGMIRDVATDKVDYERIFDGPMADRWAQHLTTGCAKYPDTELGVPNWMLARGKGELVRARKSAVRHFRQWLRGDLDEDHAAATIFNMNLYEYVKKRMAMEEK